jgi:cephalosporin hydroxylase
MITHSVVGRDTTSFSRRINMTFDEELKRINNIVIGKGGGWKNYTTVGHIYEEAKQYFEFLIEYFGTLMPMSFLEIGVLKGGNFVLTGELLGPNFAVGIDNGSYRLQGEYNAIQATAALSPSFSYEIFLADSHKPETKEKITAVCSSYDLIYIDGDHSYEGVKQDFEMYGGLIRCGGLIVFHDIANQTTGVPKFWAEIKANHKHLEFIHQKKGTIVGIGVIFP